MEVVILSKEVFEAMQEDIKYIRAEVKRISSPAEHFVDNKAFLQLMGISSRTAQSWRDEHKIAYSQEGKKIYYRFSDIEKFLNKYHRKAIV